MPQAHTHIHPHTHTSAREQTSMRTTCTLNYLLRNSWATLYHSDSVL